MNRSLARFAPALLALAVSAGCAGDDSPADMAAPDAGDASAAAPDLARLDLAMPDLAMPDLATPDLASPDLAGCSAVKLDGVAAVAVAPPLAAYDFAGSFTVELWAFPTAIGVPAQQVLVAHQAPGGGELDGYRLALNVDLRPFFWVEGDDGTNTEVAGNATVTSMAWHHLAGVFDAQARTMSLYVDGALVGGPSARPFAKARAMPTAPISIGAIDNENDHLRKPFVGYVNQVRLSSTARYAAAFTPDDAFTVDADTVGLWPFQERGGTTAADQSAQNNDATLQDLAEFAAPPSCH